MRGDSTVYKKRHSTIGRAIFKISMDGTFFAVLKFLPAREIVCLPEVSPCPRITPHHIPSQISSCNESRSSPRLSSFGNEPRTDQLRSAPLSFGRTPRHYNRAKGKGSDRWMQPKLMLIWFVGELCITLLIVERLR